MRTDRHLQQRWAEHGAGGKWDPMNAKIDEGRIRSIQVQSRLKSLLAHPYPSLKTIEYLFYRSRVFPNLKKHVMGQIIGSIALTEALFIFAHLSLVKSFLSGTLLATLLHFQIISSKDKKWKKAFIKVFPLSLDIITRGLKSGLTLGRGIAVVSEEIEDPVGSEFNYIASQLQLGVNPDTALVEAAARIGIEEFRFFTLALIIQREMGGSLADILEKLSEVIREREKFEKKVWTLSSESRATAMIVGALPVIMAVIIEIITPGYIKYFFVDPKGQMMLGISIGLTLTGVIMITRMMSPENLNA